MKPLLEISDSAWMEIEKMRIINDAVPIVENHITPPPDAAALRKAEVARIAEGLFIAACGFDKDRDIATNTLAQNAFKDAEDFVSYKEKSQ
jgi:hypothetical protein